MHLPSIADEVLSKAIAEVKAKRIPVFTFALYFDHESEALSVCVDTEDNSARTSASINVYNAKHFHGAIQQSDLRMAHLWQANVGRSLSIGDFVLVNAARTEVLGIDQDEALFLQLVRSLVAREFDVLNLAPSREKLIFACSGLNSEVEYVWSAKSDT